MAEGTTPLDVLLGMMRGSIEFDEDRFEAAKAAAPYVHPKLVATKVDGEVKFSLGQLLTEMHSKDEAPAVARH